MSNVAQVSLWEMTPNHLSTKTTFDIYYCSSILISNFHEEATVIKYNEIK